MDKKPRVTLVIGTRPEAIKFVPIIKTFCSEKKIKTRIVLTGQHKELVDEIFDWFELKEDINLNLFKKNQSLTYISCKILEGLENEFNKFPPDLVMVQGDTSSAFIAALAAFYKKIDVAHVEAGLRTDDLMQPFPEEANRRLISQISCLHFAPTKLAKENLIKSNVSGKIFITGNTVIDCLFMILKKQIKNYEIKNFDWCDQKVILTTIHRRENWGQNLLEIIKGIKKVIEKYNDLYFLIPLHPNKIVRDTIKKHLSNIKQVFLVEHLKYDQLAYVMQKCTFVLTDSGGLQEEAPSLGKPVLVLRNKTERKESLESGVAKLIGCDSNNIFKEIDNLISNKSTYLKMSKSTNPYGDGTASEKILINVINYLYS